VAGSFKATSNQPGFQPQSTVKSAAKDTSQGNRNSISPGETQPVEKLSVSREWINQRVQNAVDAGASKERLNAFSDRNDAAASALNLNASPERVRQRLNRDTAMYAGFAGTQGPGEHSYFVSGRQGQPSSSHTITVPSGASTPGTPQAITVPSGASTPGTPQAPSFFRSKAFRNGAIGVGVGLGAYGLYRALKKDDISEKKGEALHPVVERALRAKVASGPGLDWHRPVNALSYAAFAAPYLSQTVHDNHKLTTALNAAGLLGLGATSADSLAKGDSLAGYDLAGLGLMGAGLVHGALRPTPTPGAGH
jgi:hypothetical protein